MMQAADKTQTKLTPRETARAVLLDVLGLESEDSSEGMLELRDEDDFYLLGGDSLMAVQAVDRLEQLGFQVDLSVLYQTGNIGEILDSLVPPEDAAKGSDKLKKRFQSLSMDDELKDGMGNLHVEVVEWTGAGGNAGTNNEPTAEEIKKLVTDIFIEKDVVYRALGLSRADLESVVSDSLPEGCNKIVLLAYCSSLNATGSTDRELVGAALATPVEQDHKQPVVTKKASLLIRYLLSSYPPPCESNGVGSVVSKKPSLYVSMIGVVPSTTNEFFGFPDPTGARWKRMVLEILSRMEHKILEMAKSKGYGMVERVNTSEITTKVSSDLGYQMVSTTSLGKFAATEQIEVDPKYHSHQSCYMVKYLDD